MDQIHHPQPTATNRWSRQLGDQLPSPAEMSRSRTKARSCLISALPSNKRSAPVSLLVRGFFGLCPTHGRPITAFARQHRAARSRFGVDCFPFWALEQHGGHHEVASRKGDMAIMCLMKRPAGLPTTLRSMALFNIQQFPARPATLRRSCQARTPVAAAQETQPGTNKYAALGRSGLRPWVKATNSC
jgi:hypothetical protein